ncbi:hypothetical protein SLS58_009544 [Diplodia intermedia]|uniref:Fumarylacetoacetase-like C-terminal domain-containing protein n=1 Tax=Diplodia intermedia TaxID=856260 RepID=A0ABR3TBJ2_9PEZI
MAANYTNYVSYKDPATNRPRIGHLNLDHDTIHALSFKSGEPIHSLYQVIAAGEEHICLDEFEDPCPASTLKILPPITGRDILAVGKNYFEHAKEFNQSGFDSSDKVDVPSHPVIFTKRATSVIAHGERIYHHPEFTQSLDYEGEIGVIIGKAGYRVKEETALDHVWGYTIINDVTARERQRDHKQFFIGKSGDTFCPMGPIAKPAHHLPDVLRVQTVVNGKLEQDATSKDLIFSVPFLIKTLSEGMTLQPGDVIATGTPAGVGIGKTPPVYLSPGDTVSISVTGLGTLTNTVTADLPPPPSIDNTTDNDHLLPPPVTTHLLRATLPSPSPNNTPTTVFFLPTPGFPASTFSALCATLQGNDITHLTATGPTRATTATTATTLSALAKPIHTILLTSNTTTTTTTNPSPTALITHGLSALTALHLAASSTTPITKLILINPPPPQPLDDATRRRLHALLLQSRAGDTTATATASVADIVEAHEVGSKAKRESPLGVAACRLAAEAGENGGGAWARARGALARGVVVMGEGEEERLMEEAMMEKVRAEVLVVVGSEDWMAGSPGRVREWVEAGLTGGGLPPRREVRVLEGVGHWAMLEDVGGVAEAVRGFLAS